MPEGTTAGSPRYRRSTTAVWRRLRSRVVLADGTNRRDPIVLNPTGALVWDLLDRPRSLDELVQALLILYEGDESTIHDDVDGLLDQLRDHDVVILT